MEETERAYLAGLIDGEGSIFCGYRSESNAAGGIREWFELHCVISNSDRGMIDWLEHLFPDVPVAKLNTPSMRNARLLVPLTKWKPVWQWKASNRKAGPVIEQALPYLITKRRQAEIAVELIATQRNPGRPGYPPEVREHRRGLYDDLKALNRKGVA